MLAAALAEAAAEKKGRDITILEMTRLIDYSDAFVIVSAGNRRQVQAIAAEMKRVAKERFDITASGMEGFEAARWVLVDFGAVICHIFDEPLRSFYNLDGLWSDAPRIPGPEGEKSDRSWPA